MRHLSLQQQSAFADDALTGVTLEIVDRHLAACDECRTRQMRLQRLDGVLVQMIRREPEEAWLERVAVELDQRLRAEAAEASGPPALPATRPPTRSPAAAAFAAYASAAAAPPASAAPASEPAGTAPPVPAASEPAAPAPPDRTTIDPPAPRPAPQAPRWAAHAERVVRARRDAADKPRDTMLPLIAGLAGGALAGAFIVTIAFGPRPSTSARRTLPAVKQATTPAALPDRSPSPGAGQLRPAMTPPPAVVPAPAPVREPVVEAAPPVRRPATRTQPAPSPATETPRPAAIVSAPPQPATPRPQPVRTAPAPAPADRPDPDGDWPMLCGIVVDETGSPISGARVLLADLDLGARTDRRGRFCISGPAGDRTMSVVALGFSTYRQIVTLSDSTPELSVTLKAPR